MDQRRRVAVRENGPAVAAAAVTAGAATASIVSRRLLADCIVVTAAAVVVIVVQTVLLLLLLLVVELQLGGLVPWQWRFDSGTELLLVLLLHLLAIVLQMRVLL